MDLAALTTVRTCTSIVEAEVARTALEAAGIEATIRHDDCGGQGPQLGLMGVELLVRSEDAARAEEILATAATPGADESFEQTP